MAKKNGHPEEHTDETWLIPYADMLTLLLALFIVMFAMSQVNKAKFDQMSEQFRIVFKTNTGTYNNGNTTGGNGEDTGYPVDFDDSSDSSSGSVSSGNFTGQTSGTGYPGVYNYISEDEWLNAIKDQLLVQVDASGYTGKILISLDTVGLKISLQEFVLFRSGDAEIASSTYPMLMEVARMFQTLDNSIRVEGHTDNVPMYNEKYRSNWDLSVMRAINVMQFLITEGDLRPERFSVQGFGEYSPKYDNSTEEGRAQNRRVEISLIRKYTEDEQDSAVSK